MVVGRHGVCTFEFTKIKNSSKYSCIVTKDKRGAFKGVVRLYHWERDTNDTGIPEEVYGEGKYNVTFEFNPHGTRGRKHNVHVYENGSDEFLDECIFTFE